MSHLDTMKMKIFTLSLRIPFYDMFFFCVYNNLRQLLLPAERKKVLYVIMITASRDKCNDS